jgi:hypothetical protein
MRVGDHREYILARIRIEDRGHSTPCWIWQQGLTEKGYGDCSFNGRHTRSHRIAYAAFVGAIPDGLQIDHLCRVKECCNPAHLEAVTNDENHRRSVPFRADYQREFCSRGHALTDDNRIFRMRDGKLIKSGCLTCRREYARNYMRDFHKRNAERLNAARRVRKLRAADRAKAA